MSILQAVLRTNIYFSARGRYAVCIGHTISGERFLERWSLGAPTPAWQRVISEQPVPSRCQLTPCDDGRVLLLGSGDNDADGRREISLFDPAHGWTSIGFVTGLSARLIGAPYPETLAYVVVTEPSGDTALFRVDARDLSLTKAGTVPGAMGSMGWLDLTQPRLGFTHIHKGQIRPAAITLGGMGEFRPEPLPCPEDEATHLLLASPTSGMLLASGTKESPRLAWSATDDETPIRFPEALNRTEGMVLPLAMSPSGNEIAIGVTRGVSSRLKIWSAESDELHDVDLGIAGRVSGIGCWTSTGLRFPYSAPAFPPGIATVSVSTGRVRFDPQSSERDHWEQARTEVFAGPAGPIEAIVYGDWRHAECVVVALHGGPEAAWRLDFEPVFQHLAADGVAIVAPNQRGSSGYSAEHRRAIQGAWGGPDLADVLHLATTLSARRRRGRLCLYGVSYGAYLALLAAAYRPETWDRCVAVAPFLSGARLYAQAGAPVRRMVERLGGDADTAGEFGTRDLTSLCARLSMPLMLVHGTADAVIPVSQARDLLGMLRRDRLDRGAGVTLLEIPEAGHDPFYGPRAPDLLARVSEFLQSTMDGR